MASHLHCGAGRRAASRHGCGRAAARSWAVLCGGASTRLAQARECCPLAAPTTLLKGHSRRLSAQGGCSWTAQSGAGHTEIGGGESESFRALQGRVQQALAGYEGGRVRARARRTFGALARRRKAAIARAQRLLRRLWRPPQVEAGRHGAAAAAQGGAPRAPQCSAPPVPSLSAASIAGLA
jgi:hypothetical protein